MQIKFQTLNKCTLSALSESVSNDALAPSGNVSGFILKTNKKQTLIKNLVEAEIGSKNVTCTSSCRYYSI